MAQDHFDTIVGSNVILKGNLSNQGSIEIHGRVEGEISSDADVIVGQSANIVGPITASNIIISGQICGSIIAREKLEMESTAKVEGDIQTTVLSIKPGAIFNGSCKVGGEGAGELKTTKKPKMELED